jgi:glycosyltransferase involved in cell wall biosynthesis
MANGKPLSMTIDSDSRRRGPVSRSQPPGLRVLHLIDHMGAGGAQRLILDLAESHGTGIEMGIASLRNHCLPEAASRMEQAGVSYTALGFTRRNPSGIHRLWRLIRHWRPDIVHTHLEVSNTFSVIASLFQGDNRPLLVNHLHNDPCLQHSLPFRLAGWLLAPNFAAHIAPTGAIALSVTKAFGNRHQLMEIIPNGIDPAWLEHGPTRRTAALREGAQRVIGTIGRLVPQKSTRTLLQATPRLLAAEPSTRIIVVGDGPLMPELKAEARDLGIGESVSFLGFSADLVSIYSALDVFVLPSRYEGFPISLLEAMAMGTLVVATNVTGISDAVENGINGLLVPYDRPADLACAILQLFSDNHLSNTLRENARDRVRKRYTRDVFAARMESLYTRLCPDTAGVTPGTA